MYDGPFEALAGLLVPDADPYVAARDLEWKYARNPHGKGEIWTIRSSSEIAALVAIYRRNMLVGHEQIPGGLNADLVVHPAHRRKGLAVRVLKETFPQAINFGFKMAFGFPNEISLPAQRHADGWTELGTLRAISMPPNPIHSWPRRAAARLPQPIATPVGRAVDLLGHLHWPSDSRLDGLVIGTDSPDAAEYDLFWKRVCASGRYMGARDFAWHRWRFFEKPSYSCSVHYARSGSSLEGYIAMACRPNPRGLLSAVVLDVLCADPEREKALLSIAPALARSARAIQLVFPRVGSLAPEGWRFLREAATAQVFFVRSFDSSAVDDVGIGRLPWYFTLADSDVA
jgi:GNAT superfamily N-acetyltransferase